jgi:hypothetical protein
VLDLARAWSPPFNPGGVITEITEDILPRYNNLTVIFGDRYAPGFVAEHFRAKGIRYEPSQLDRSQLYLELLPLVNSRQVVLLDLPDLMRELRGLERRRGPTGRDRVDHLRGSRDDLANSAAGSLVYAMRSGQDCRAAEFARLCLFPEEGTDVTTEWRDAPFGTRHGE